MNSSSAKLFLVIAGLAILIVIGSYIYKQKQKPAPYKANQQTTQTTPQEQKDSSSKTLPVLPASPSAVQAQNYYKQVADIAVESETLSITKCKGDPAVVKFKKGQKLILKNNDDVKLSINVDPDNRFPLNAKESKTVQPQIKVGLYHVACEQEGNTTEVAIFYVLP